MPDGVFKDEDISLDVQELTESIENKNANSQNYWLYIVCGLKRFLVKKNSEGALNLLAVSDKRYH